MYPKIVTMPKFERSLRRYCSVIDAAGRLLPSCSFMLSSSNRSVQYDNAEGSCTSRIRETSCRPSLHRKSTSTILLLLTKIVVKTV